MSIESGMMYPAPNTQNTKSNHAPWPDNSCDNGISPAEKGYDVIVWQVIGPILRLLWIYLCGMANVHAQHGEGSESRQIPHLGRRSPLLSLRHAPFHQR